MYSVETVIGNQKLIFQSGKLAKQANGAVTVQLADTVVLATAVASDSMKEGTDFFPLTVDYREKTSAAGRIPGGYIKREGRPTEKEILTARLTDRPIRPLFPDGFYYEVQIMNSVLSADGENDPDILSMIGASASLVISDIPFLKPVGAVRVGLVDDELIANPTTTQLKTSKIDIVVAGTADGVMMVEGSSHEVSEDIMINAIDFAHAQIKKIVDVQIELQKLCGKPKKNFALYTINEDLLKETADIVESRMEDTVMTQGKSARQEALSALQAEAIEKITAKFEDQYAEADIKQAFSKIQKDAVRRLILEKGLRGDGRGPEDIRQITCEVGLLPRTHGSALFTRGETQALAITTLGSPGSEQRMEELSGETTKSFMLHYNFPPFSVGECRPVRGPGRREIGHGILAERSLQYVIPKAEDFPYVIRLISDILESNGSSSMASVCGGTLSLMDAGVPIKAPVAGIAMGLVKEGDKVVVLSDILGSEDACGDMDFKVSGTASGITAFQMDLKIEGISQDIMKTALEQARKGRLHILDIMVKTLDKPRANISDYAPRISTMQIDPDKIGTVIGPGGKVIKKMIEDFKVTIDINDDGIVSVASTEKDAVEKAMNHIRLLTAEPEVGVTYDGVVKGVAEFGAFVEILPGKDGMVHVSKLSEHRLRSAADVLSVGDKVVVKVAEIDDRGRVNLDIISGARPYDPSTAGPAPKSNRPDRDRDRGGRRHDKGDSRRRY